MNAPCAGLHVLDLSLGPAAGIATMILGDFGAEVTKVEPPGGDPFRRLAAAPMWLRGKQSLVLDLKRQPDVATLHRLAEEADITVVSYRPGVAERLGADETTLRARNPKLIYCAVTGFGPLGPYRHYKGYEGIVAAKSGRMMSFSGQIPREGPAFAAVQVGVHAAAQGAVQGILAALLVRERTGRGQRVETSLLQGMLPYDMAGLATRQLVRNHPDQFPSDPLALYNRRPTLQYQPVLTRDGRWLQLGNLIEHQFHAFLGAAGLSEIYADPRFSTAPNLGDADREALRQIILTRMQERTADEWMEIFVADGNIASEPIVSTQEALEHPQLVHNGDVIERDIPRHGRMRQLGPVARLSATPGAVPAETPAVGEHDGRSNGIARAERAYGAVAAGSTPANAGAVRHPLEGVTVLEFATIIAAPLGCALLADLGARVIKVEAPEGDPLRTLGNGVSGIKTTAGKESICLDLKKPEARAIAARLIERADVLVHNYRPGVPERLGIGYEEADRLNPRLVYVAAMGYGPDGPYAHRPSAHPVAGAGAGGALWQAGGGMPPPAVDSLAEIDETARRFMRANEVNPDPNTAVVIATAALLGLYAQRTRGIGQRVDVNMFLANAYANADDFLSYTGKPPRPLVDAELFGLHALYRLYQTADGWVFLACPTDQEWETLCRTAGWEHLLGDPRFTGSERRATHDDALAGVLSALLRERTADSWEVLFTTADVACVRACKDTPASFWDGDPHPRENGFVRETEHPRWGTLWRHGPLVTLSEAPPRCGPGTLAGEHSDAILRWLGYSIDEIVTLRASGAVASGMA